VTRLYYTDASCLTFDAVVTRVLMHEDKPAVILDRTAFYPTSGGQPFDIGRLGDVEVLDVVDRDEEIVHVLSSPLAEGLRVTGTIDADRRFDHMQQHTGQHVLSAAFDRLLGNRTVSFHMGAETCTIDLASDVAATDLSRVVAEANRIVWEDRPVTIRFVSEEEAAGLPLRKEPARTGALRLIDVENFDLSACGGTHVSRTGAIGMIAVLATERLRGGVRVTFVCGGRALRTLETYRDAVVGSVRILSVLPPELPAAVERVHNESRDLRKAMGRLQERLAEVDAMRLVQEAEHVGALRLVATLIPGLDASGLKAMASAATREAGIVVVLVSDPPPCSIVIARSAGVAVDAGQALKTLASRFGGRGGGRPEMAQGGGLQAPAADILSAARDLVIADRPEADSRRRSD
jgi:alanyl-tRNA synthetase